MLLVRSIGDNSPQTPPTLEDDVMELDAGAGNGEDDDEDGDEVKALSKDNILGMPPTPPAVVDEKMPQRFANLANLEMASDGQPVYRGCVFRLLFAGSRFRPPRRQTIG